MIVCDFCKKERVDKDGDFCPDCTEEMRPKTILDYLEGYLEELEDFENRYMVTDRYLDGLKKHIKDLKND